MRTVPIAALVVCLLAVACAGSAPELGSLFADAYTAFAPLYALYRSYAQHLFSGTAVAIPDGLPGACAAFAEGLALFHVDYVVQTASATPAGVGYLLRLRAETTAFCDAHDATIRAIVESDDADALDEASDEGLFAEIKRMNDLLEITLDEILAGMGEGSERWSFAVTFSMRTLLSQPEAGRIDPSLREILYADPEATAPPFAVPPEIAEAMERLLGLSGRDLTDAERDASIGWATAIYDYFTTRP